MNTEEILAERGNRYGRYTSNSRVMQRLKDALRSGDSWRTAPDTVKEALESLCIKLGRIVNGDPTYQDNWDDAIGYLTLALEELKANAAEQRGGVQSVPVTTAASIPFPSSPAFLTGMTQVPTTMQQGHNRTRTIDPMPAGPPGTEPTDASHAAEPVVPRRSASGVHLTTDHVGMFFRLAGENQSPVRLQANDGPEYDRFPFKAHNRRYTQYGLVAAADGDPIHDIVAFHPH